MGVTEKAVLYSLSRFSWELGEVGAAKPDGARLLREAPAAFGRLCVETHVGNAVLLTTDQPPSGGCVLKPCNRQTCACFIFQPPSGGCVLKHFGTSSEFLLHSPAAFGRLCVETGFTIPEGSSSSQPPSGGCVLKLLCSYF